MNELVHLLLHDARHLRDDLHRKGDYLLLLQQGDQVLEFQFLRVVIQRVNHEPVRLVPSS